MGVNAMGVGKQAGGRPQADMRTPRLSYEMGGACGRIVFFHARGRGRFIPRPLPLFWLSFLVALDGAVCVPAHRSKIEAEGQDRHGTRGKTDAHEW